VIVLGEEDVALVPISREEIVQYFTGMLTQNRVQAG
jgi:hypothetical protein